MMEGDLSIQQVKEVDTELAPDAYEQITTPKGNQVEVNALQTESEMQKSLSTSKKCNRSKYIMVISAIFTLILIASCATYFGLGNKAEDLFKSGNENDVILGDMVLPNTTINVDYIDNETVYGDITFYEEDFVSDSLVFEWKSFQNESYAFVSFMASSSDDLLNELEEELNGYYGFEFNVNNIRGPPGSNVTFAESQKSMLNVLLYKINVNDPFIVSVGDNDTLSNAELHELESMTAGLVGEYFAELSIKLGAYKYIGSSNNATNSIHQYGRFITNVVKQSDLPNNWKWDRISDSVRLTNAIVSDDWRTINEFKESSTSNNNNGGIGRRLLSLLSDQNCLGPGLSAPASDFFKLGDGRCDTALNNANCNWDNGDCCENTCNDQPNWRDHQVTGYSWWTGLAYYENWYVGYDCSVNGDFDNCLPSCTGNKALAGDGNCDSALDTEACNNDNGDCSTDTWNQCERYYCNNVNLGTCGVEDYCYEWLCGDCGCHAECSEHDSHCGCYGYTSAWCLNLFWVNCNGGSTPILCNLYGC